MSDDAFGGSSGDMSTNGVATAANTAAMTSNGSVTEDFSTSPASNFSITAQAIGNAFMQAFGIQPAEAAGLITDIGGTPVGFHMLTLHGSMSLASFIASNDLTIDPEGYITNIDGGFVGAILGTEWGGSLAGFVVYDVTTNETVNIDTVGVPVQLELSNGTQGTWNQIAPGAWQMLTQIGGKAVTQPNPAPYCGLGPNSTLGVPLMDYPNAAKLAQPNPGVQSCLLPWLVGGLNNDIWDIRTGTRVVPRPGWGSQTEYGYAIGEGYAPYWPSDLYYAVTAQGRAIIMVANEPITVIDPSTGKLFAPVAYFQVQVYAGSQQIRLVNYAGYGYTGPLPSNANPCYTGGGSYIAVTALPTACSAVQGNQ